MTIGGRSMELGIRIGQRSIASFSGSRDSATAVAQMRKRPPAHRKRIGEINRALVEKRKLLKKNRDDVELILFCFPTVILLVQRFLFIVPILFLLLGQSSKVHRRKTSCSCIF
mmetsp:Transcript_55421/g.82445  ORF Transcript_55421/g.82445 Transcript_55421/m.82445 type:complete len:113 (-) Transcript_55421:241-579(-)